MRIITYGEIASPTDIQEIHEYAEAFVNLQTIQVELNNFQRIFTLNQYSEGIGTIIVGFIVKALKFISVLFGSFYIKIFSAIIAAIAIIVKLSKKGSTASMSAGGGGGGGGGGSSTTTVIKDNGEIKEIKVNKSAKIKNVEVQGVDPVSTQNVEIKCKVKESIANPKIKSESEIKTIKSKIEDMNASQSAAPIQNVASKISQDQTLIQNILKLFTKEDFESIKSMTDSISDWFHISDNGLLTIPGNVYDIIGYKLITILGDNKLKSLIIPKNIDVRLRNIDTNIPRVKFSEIGKFINKLAERFGDEREHFQTINDIIKYSISNATPEDKVKWQDTANFDEYYRTSVLWDFKMLMYSIYQPVYGNKYPEDLTDKNSTVAIEDLAKRQIEFINNAISIYKNAYITKKSETLDFILTRVSQSNFYNMRFTWGNDDDISIDLSFDAMYIMDGNKSAEEVSKSLKSKSDELKKVHDRVANLAETFSKIDTSSNNEEMKLLVVKTKEYLNVVTVSMNLINEHLMYAITSLNEVPKYTKISNSIKENLVKLINQILIEYGKNK